MQLSAVRRRPAGLEVIVELADRLKDDDHTAAGGALVELPASEQAQAFTRAFAGATVLAGA